MQDTLVPRTPRRLVGRGMSSRYGPLFEAFARAFLDDIPYPEDAAERIRKLAEEGVVVYVHRARNPVDYLALSRAAVRHGLPVARFVGGLGVFPWQPWWRLLARRRGLRGAPKDAARREEWLLQQCVLAGDAAELFLRRPLTLVSTQSAFRARYVEALVEVQRRLERPIYLVPHFLSLRGGPGRLEPTAADAVFGTVEEPGLLRAFFRLMLSRGRARWEVSEPINLKAFVEEHADQKNAVLAKKVRWSVLHHLARVERVAHGPPKKPPSRLREEAFKDPHFRGQLGALAEEEGEPLAALERRAVKIFDEIAARFDMDVARVLDRLLKLVWNRIYDGLEWDKEGLERMRRAARQGPLVIVPSHRSHVDYLVMSQILLWEGLSPPLVAAGANLSFFPLGPIFRRGGAYFIRRTFRGDRLYSLVLRAYIKRLLREGFSQEFFIEGGRSRTGKTLPPRMGMVSMIVEAFLESRIEDVIFVPACISYEKIVEAQSYTRELGGGEKEKESAGALVRSAGVLRSKYGVVFVTFDEPISLAKVIKERGVRSRLMPDEERRQLGEHLAYRIAYGINRAQVVTANALVITALFGFRRRGVSRGLIGEAVRLLIEHIQRVAGSEARFSSGLLEAREEKVSLALARLVEDGLVHEETAAKKTFFCVDDGAWLELEYFKNNILHHFVPDAILATAGRSCGLTPGGGAVSRERLAERAKLLSRVFKREFIYRVDKGFDALFEETLSRVTRLQFLIMDDKGVRMPATDRAREGLPFSANLIRNFVESYASVLRHVEEAVARSESQKALVLSLLDHVKADYLSGEITCPEAVSKANVENAVWFLEDQGALRYTQKRPLFDPPKEAKLSQIAAVLEDARRSA